MRMPTNEERAAAGLRYAEQEAKLQATLCHPGKVDYEADFGAPGCGQSWKCEECGKHWVRIGLTFIDPDAVPTDEEPPWILTLEDVR